MVFDFFKKSKKSGNTSPTDATSPEVSLGSGSVATPSSFSATQSQEDALQLLKKFDTVIIVDDSGSMAGTKWSEAQRALEQVAVVAAKYDTDGIEIRFLNSSVVARNVKNAQHVMELFRGVPPEGLTPIGKTLDSLLSPYLQLLESKVSVKPVNYIVITDGAASEPKNDPLYPETVIVSVAKKLDEYDAPMSQVGIQFVQIGNNAGSAAFLKELDDGLKNKHKIRDIIDTTLAMRGKPLDLIKILTGSVNRRVDNGGSAALF